jgi:tetratricopeptide (TPR) repeat protein
MEHRPGEILLGRYEVRAVIAHGPSTITYAALDVASKRRVGLRHWPADNVPPQQAVAEIEREVELGEHVNNVHVPRYVEHFSIPSASSTEHYLVHDASEGQTLAQWAQQRTRSELELRGVALSLLRALDALHRERFVHGRVCADEVLVRGDGRVFLMGLAAKFDPRTGVASDLRGLGEAISIATQGRMSPAFGAWLQRLLSSDGARGFTHAYEALHALHELPTAPSIKPWMRGTFALMALAAAGAALFFAWSKLATHDAAKPVAASAQPDLPPAITDTSFVPKPIADARGLRLTRVRSMIGHHHSVADVAFDSTGTRLVSASDDGSIIVWNLDDGQPASQFSHSGKVGAVAFMGSQHVLSGGGGSARVWDAPSGHVLLDMSADSKRVTAVCSTHAGRYVLSSGYDGSIHVFDGETGKLVRLMQQPPKVYALAVDPLGEHVASAGDDGIVHLFRFADGSPEGQLRGHSKAIATVVFLADGNTLASGSNDRTVRLWDVGSGTQKLVLQGHRSEIWALAGDPSGKLLASGSKDGELRIWDTSSGALAYAEQLDGRGLSAIAFSPDGERIAVGGGSNRVDLYALLMQQASWRPPPVTAPVAPTPLPLPGSSASAKLVAKARALIAAGADARPEAGMVLRQAIALEPKDNDACLELARIDLLDNHLDEATQSAQRCDQRNPGDARTQALLVEIAAADKQDDLVLQRAHALIDSNPDPRTLASVYTVLRQLYLRRGEIDAAEEVLRSEINLSPAQMQRKLDLAEFLIEHERYDEAIAWARAAQAQSETPAAHVTLGSALAGNARLALEDGKRGDFETWLARAFTADPHSAEGHYVRALALKRDHDVDGARRELRAALASNPNHPGALAALR